jgi:hypothetical protein
MATKNLKETWNIKEKKYLKETKENKAALVSAAVAVLSCHSLLVSKMMTTMKNLHRFSLASGCNPDRVEDTVLSLVS